MPMPERIWAGVYGAGTHDEYGEWDTDANETCGTEYIRADLAVLATTHQRTIEALREAEEARDDARAARNEAGREWRRAFDKMHQRAMAAEAALAAIAPAEPVTDADLERAVQHIGGGSTFDREDRLDIARAILTEYVANHPSPPDPRREGVEEAVTMRILPFHKAPPELRNLSPHGGDEDWIAIVPKTADFAYVPFLEDCDRWFGCCSISHHEHPNYPNCTICIGAHA